MTSASLLGSKMSFEIILAYSFAISTKDYILGTQDHLVAKIDGQTCNGKNEGGTILNSAKFTFLVCFFKFPSILIGSPHETEE